MPGIRRIDPKGTLQAAGSCHKVPAGASTRRGLKTLKMVKISAEVADRFRNAVRGGPIRPECPAVALRKQAIVRGMRETRYIRTGRSTAVQVAGSGCRTIHRRAKLDPRPPCRIRDSSA